MREKVSILQFFLFAFIYKLFFYVKFVLIFVKMQFIVITQTSWLDNEF